MAELFGAVFDAKITDRIVSKFKYPSVTKLPSGAKQVKLLYEACYKVLKTYPVENQETDDCVSFAWAGGVNVLKCIRINQGKRESYKANTCSEAIYGLSRVEIGKNRLRGGGSIGAWGAEAVTKYGTLLRSTYNKYDLTRYSADRAIQWGNKGLPDELEPVSKEHLCKTTSLVTNGYEEVRDLICAGCPVVICSQQGFNKVRDKEGFLNPKGYWPHAMLIIGVDDSYKRPGVCIMNSWGPNWVSGPKRNNQPDGSFWADANVIDHMVSSGDTFALSAIDGYPSHSWVLI